MIFTFAIYVNRQNVFVPQQSSKALTTIILFATANLASYI